MKCNLCSRKIFGWHTHTHSTHSQRMRDCTVHNMCLAAGECVCLWSEFQFIYSIQIHECRAQDIHIRFAEAFLLLLLLCLRYFIPDLYGYTGYTEYSLWRYDTWVKVGRVMLHATPKEYQLYGFVFTFMVKYKQTQSRGDALNACIPICRFRAHTQKLYARTHSFAEATRPHKPNKPQIHIIVKVDKRNALAHARSSDSMFKFASTTDEWENVIKWNLCFFFLYSPPVSLTIPVTRREKKNF